MMGNVGKYTIHGTYGIWYIPSQMDHLFFKDLFITSPHPRNRQALDNFLGKVDGSPTRRRRIAGLCCDFGRPVEPFEPEQHIVFPAQKVKSHGKFPHATCLPSSSEYLRWTAFWVGLFGVQLPPHVFFFHFWFLLGWKACDMYSKN